MEEKGEERNMEIRNVIDYTNTCCCEGSVGSTHQHLLGVV